MWHFRNVSAATATVLTLFGGAGVAGTPVARPTVGRLLALFALNRNHYLSRDSICEAMWPGEPDNPNRLRIALSRLRTTLREAPIAAQLEGTSTYRLSIADDDTDVGRFESLMSEATTVAGCRLAIKLWTGEPYLELADSGEGFAEAERLRRLRHHTLAGLAERLLRADRPQEALEGLALMLPSEQPDEGRARLSMQAYYRLGRHTEALAVAQHLRRQLCDEFGLEMSPATRALEQAVLRHDLDDSHTSMVAREHERAVFASALLRSAAEGMPITVIRGVSGVGKSRLASELLQLAANAGVVVAHASCHDEVASGSFRMVFSLLHQVFPDIDEASLDAPYAETDRTRFFAAVAKLIAGHSAKAPILWFIDDIQWADEPSRALMLELLRSVAPQGFSVMMAQRSDEPHTDASTQAWLRLVSATRKVSFMDLEGLIPDDLQRLSVHVGRTLSAEEARKLHWQTRGLPFLAIELLRSEADATKLPATIDEAIGARLSRLGTVARTLLDLVAVCPQGVELSLLVLVFGRSPEEAADALDVLERSGLLQSSFDAGRVSIHLQHDILRRSLITRLGVVRSVTLHRQFADRCEQRGAVSESAFHSWSAGSAGDNPATIRRCLAAANKALLAKAYEDAAVQVERALQAGAWNDGVGANNAADRAGDAAAWLLLAQARHRLGDPAGRRAAAERACRCARLADDWATFGLAALEHGGIRSTYGIASIETMALLDEALRHVPPHDRGLGARIAARAGQEAYHVRRFADADAFTSDADATARAVGDPAVLALTLEGRVWAAHRPERLAERIAAGEEMVALAVGTGQRETELIGRIWRACANLELGRIESIDTDLPTMIDLSDELRVPSHEFRVCALRSTMATTRGNYGDAMVFAQQALAIGQRIEPRNAEQSFAAQLVSIVREQGGLAMALPMVEPMIHDYSEVAGWRCAFAFVLAQAGEHDRALHEIDALSADRFAIVPRDLAWLMAMSYLADTACDIGASHHAEALLGLLAPYAQRHVGLFDLAWNGAVAHYLGRLSILAGDHASGRQHLEAALLEHRRVNSPGLIARTEAELSLVAV